MADQRQGNERLEGRVKWFSRDKGFGFIVGDDGVERYYNVRAVRGAELPNTGDWVEFEHAAGNRGPRAIAVTLAARAAREPGHGRVLCQSCGKAMVPRLISYRGEPDKSLCPFCGATYREFRTAGFCFIATAVYGDPCAPEVEALRFFRDYSLMPHVAGRLLVRTYYRLSPPVAAFLKAHPKAAGGVRRLLDTLIRVVLVQGRG